MKRGKCIWGVKGCNRFQVSYLGWGIVVAVLVSQPVWAEEKARSGDSVGIMATPRLSDVKPPATNVKEWRSQTPLPNAQTLLQVTNVKLNSTDAGIEVILETPQGELLQPVMTQQNNTLIADIPNAVLVLPTGEFRANNPVAGITLITVTNQETSTIRVTLTGQSNLPVVELFDSNIGLILGVTPEQTATNNEQIEIVVTGEREAEYSVPNATTATRTDTPLRDIPQSIQVVPQQVIEDQQVTQIADALRNVSGVTPRVEYGANYTYNIRGFSSSRQLRNGVNFRSGGFIVGSPTTPGNFERIEILKGPASVLYGQAEPGGIVNFVTKQPLSDPYYAAEFTAGSYSFYEPSVDLSGPLTDDRSLLYRLNASYQNFGSFIDFVNGETLSIAPVLSYRIGNATTLAVEYEYLHSDQTFNDGLPIDPIAFELPISRYLGEPSDRTSATTHNLILSLNHDFNENIRLRSTFGASFATGRFLAHRLFDFDPETNNVLRGFRDSPSYSNSYSSQTDLVAEFNTGSVQHQLLVGFDLGFHNSGYDATDSGDNFINILDPVYGEPTPPAAYTFGDEATSNTVGLYLQDQVALLPNLKLLIGGRYDFATAQSRFYDQPIGESRTSSSDEFYNEAFSPRVGLVYQAEPISLYASYSRSFVPNNARTFGGELIEPTRGTQFEVGVKTDLGRLVATLAAYEITKTNILTPDPDRPDFSIGVGEVRSRGIEFDISGEITPGWNIIASAFVNDAIVTEDNNFPVGDTLENAPRQGASLWTSYEIQSGELQGLGFGVGVFFVGDREAELPNDLVLPSYVRADASIFYRRDNWRMALNFKNLSNTQYYESSQNTAFIYPGAPFTVLGTISVQF